MRSTIVLLLSASAVLAAPAPTAVNAENISRQDCIAPKYVEFELNKTYTDLELNALVKANTICGGTTKRDMALKAPATATIRRLRGSVSA